MPPDNDISSAPLCRIVCSAIRHKETGLILCGARHFDPIMRAMIQREQELKGQDMMAHTWRSAEQGFVTNIRGEFVTREQAWKIAEAAGQIRQVTGRPGTLYSEDLY